MLSLSAALSLSMSTSDVLDPMTGCIVAAQDGGRGAGSDEIVIIEVPPSLPIDLRSKLAVCLIQLRYRVPEVRSGRGLLGVLCR